MTSFKDLDLLPVPRDTEERIAGLVERYQRHRDLYRGPHYNEARLRQEFLNPFFAALGWDMDNSRGYSEPYKEVVHEDTLRVEGSTRAPDYCFRLMGLPKFYVEAKAPATNIKTDISPAYQLRRYGWSAKLPLSVLTDFEEFAVYDCRQKPNPTDPSGYQRWLYLTYDEYLDKLQLIYSIFSHEAIPKGFFDRFAEAGRGKRGTATVDAEFLAEIERWRDELARNIALRNYISVPDLNFAVQTIIDRILFLRIAEDRGVEPENRLLSTIEAGKNLYPLLCDLFHQADSKYNSGLFDFGKTGDQCTPDLVIDDRVLKDIVSNLYYPKSPYEFSVISADILGAVYEQFLGKVIRLTPGGYAKVEEKPEVKKAGGVYYTPRYIVDYIVEHTVGEAVREAGTPEKVAKLRILDPACGSGSFLLGAYDWLLRWHLDYYLQRDPEKLAKARRPVVVPTSGGEWRLSTSERKRILQANLFGVDIDAQAVEVTKLNLLLKCLEGETEVSLQAQQQLFHERVLPNIDGNIKCGNSLIGPDYFSGRLGYDEEEYARVNPFDWEAEFPAIMTAGGFDCVIGNPPYIRIQNLTEYAPEQPPYLRVSYQAARKGNYDIYVVFVERGFSLVHQSGRLGFILPNKFLSTDYGGPLRGLIAEQRALRRLVDFRHHQVFARATTYTCLLFLQRSQDAAFDYVVPTTPQTLGASSERTTQAPLTGEVGWIFGDQAGEQVARRIQCGTIPLLEVPVHISRGSSSGDDGVFILNHHSGVLATADGDEVEIEEEMLRIPIFATDFGRFRFGCRADKRIIYPYITDPSGTRLLAEAELRDKYPNAFAYLKSRHRRLEKRAHAGVWYSYSAARNLALHDRAHLLVPLLADHGAFTRVPDRPSSYCLMASGGFSIGLSDTPMSSDFVLGVLNSRLLFWRLKRISNVFRAGWITCTKQYVGTLPIRPIDFSNPSDVAKHDQMVALVQTMLDLHKRLPTVTSPRKRELIERQIADTDRAIDRLVYELYELTDEEIAIVEGDG